MRHISFALTTPQILNRSKTVTRRLGWRNLKPGTLLQAVEKGQGLKKGEKVKRLAIIRVERVRRQPLRAIDKVDCIREGFPELTAAEFVEMFCKHNGCTPDAEVTRLEFSYVGE